MTRPYLKQIRMGMEQENPYIEARINGGIVTQIDTSDIENNQFVQVKNFNVRDDKTIRRNGIELFTPAKPNSKAILLLDTVRDFNLTTTILRFTEDSIHKVLWGGAAWTPITGPAFTADDTVRIHLLRLSNRIFFTDGIIPINEINLTANTYAAAGNAPKARYIAGFFNRLVCAYYTDPAALNPIQIGWSGDNNYSQFDPLVDYSSGFTYLAESPSDYDDFIMGLIPMANSMIIMKQKSIWLATKQPSASNPFNFFTVVPGIGCDAPESIRKIPNGVVWYDSRIGNVFVYLVGMTEPEVIGSRIANTLLSGILDPNHLTSAYDALNDEYSLILPSYPWPIAGTTKIWKYNFRNKAWTYEEFSNVTAISFIEDVNVRKKMYGTYDGFLLSDPHQHAASPTLDEDNGIAYTSVLQSKTYELPLDDEYIHSVRIEYKIIKAGSFILAYSKDNGITWVDYKTVILDAGDIGKRKIARFTKHIKARQFTWRLSSTDGLFEILQYAIRTFGGATSKE